MGEKMDTGQFRRFAAALDAESTRPELTAWKTTFTAAAMSIRQLADHVDFHLTQPAQAVDVERVLAALGHVRVPNTRCLARVAETPLPLRPPGPQNPTMWCCLPRSHDGQHRHNGGGMYPSIPFRDSDEVVMGDPLPDYCEKCRSIWPCDDAKAITVALTGKQP